MSRLLVTGSRDWTDRDAVVSALETALAELTAVRPGEPVVLVHGACPTGADAIAATHWARIGLPLEAHPADWRQHGRAAGPIRNAEMVARGADLCLAFPLRESRGTRGCMRLAQRAGIPVRVIEPRPGEGRRTV